MDLDADDSNCLDLSLVAVGSLAFLSLPLHSNLLFSLPAASTNAGIPFFALFVVLFKDLVVVQFLLDDTAVAVACLLANAVGVLGCIEQMWTALALFLPVMMVVAEMMIIN